MDFRYRRFALFLILIAAFWVLAQARHDVGLFRAPANMIGDPGIFGSVPITEIRLENAAGIDRFPFVALDNTCRYEIVDTELSCCTGMISGEAAIIYRLTHSREVPLYVTVRPLRSDFDAAFGLFRVGERGELLCVKGSDDKAEGWAERIRLQSLPAGVYYLVVGGYGSDCGRFELSVESTLVPPVSLRDFICTLQNGGTLIQWETDFEADLHYFNLYRVGIDGEVGQPIFQPRSRGGFSHGAQYEFFDPDVDNGLAYVLAGIDVTGREIEIREHSN